MTMASEPPPMGEKPSHDMRSPPVVKESTDDGTIGTSRGKARCKSPFLVRQLPVFFCTGKIHGGQDGAFMFLGGLANYKTHYLLS
jgi:hypothetical protein